MLCLLILSVAAGAAGGDKLLIGKRVPVAPVKGDNRVRQRGLIPQIPQKLSSQLHRIRPWSLPDQALSVNQTDTLNILVLRFNFQYETVDDPNTTGRGIMNVSRLLTTKDSTDYYDSVGHWIDPPPHNKDYFNAHMRALNNYWNWVSEGHIALKWDIYPPDSNAAYSLPYPMSHYGLCDSVIAGLERYFIDCIQLADTVNKLDSTTAPIDFGKYDDVILVHAGADRQNDLGFPPTCSDLYTGYIRFGDSLQVHTSTGTKWVRTGLILPETASQDNRATALNAVLAHEFGHSLGLVDLYNTSNFLSQLGDFSLMDDNGFGTGIDFGFKVGNVFGAIPVFPDAWSRAYLGFVPVTDFRQGTDLRLVAAEVRTEGIQIARVPISENQYYLIENRNQLTRDQSGPNGPTVTLVDRTTDVILGPTDTLRNFTGEYDFLIPGNGMLIYLVDEGVAALDYVGNGQTNFLNNTLQWDPRRKFITLMEADGVVDFGGNYVLGFGTASDMYREDRNNALTPNTNPQAIDNFGDNTHVYITNIRRDTLAPVGSPQAVVTDSVMRFDVETDKLVTGFPVRVGYPKYGLSPVADDILGDGRKEIILASGRFVSVVTDSGQNFLRQHTGCTTCPTFIDSAFSVSFAGTPHLMPLYYRAFDNITAGPVTGDFGAGGPKLVAIGDATKNVYQFGPTDADLNGRADIVGTAIRTTGTPIALSFGKVLWALTDAGWVYKKTQASALPDSFSVANTEYHGICRVGDSLGLAVVAGDSLTTRIYFIGRQIDSFAISGRYNLGPITVDLSNDGKPEVVLFTNDGDGVAVTVDASTIQPSFSLFAKVSTGKRMTANPVATDLDLDGRPDVIIPGTNSLYAFDQRLLPKNDFPQLLDDRVPQVDVIAAPITGELDRSGSPEIIVPNDLGSVHAVNRGEVSGFPLNGGVKAAGSCVLMTDVTGGYLGYVGADGWFYLWQVDSDSTRNVWPMGGHDPSGSFTLDQKQIGPPKEFADPFPGGQFFNYPNPVTSGTANFRYFLAKSPDRVILTVYDLSGRKVTEFPGTAVVGQNEQSWDCSSVTPGVYRCRIQVDFAGDTRTAFTDVAVIR